MLTLLLACTRVAPMPPPAESPAAVPGGACPDEDGVPQHITAHPIDGGTVLELSCRFYAYQGSVEFWLTRPGAEPVRLLAAVGLADFTPQSGELTVFSKARGPGDCGDWMRYRLEDGALITLEHRTRSCDAGIPEDGELPPPSTWPLVE